MNVVKEKRKRTMITKNIFMQYVYLSKLMRYSNISDIYDLLNIIYKIGVSL